jgi:hypothetical protein
LQWKTFPQIFPERLFPPFRLHFFGICSMSELFSWELTKTNKVEQLKRANSILPSNN